MHVFACVCVHALVFFFSSHCRLYQVDGVPFLWWGLGHVSIPFTCSQYDTRPPLFLGVCVFVVMYCLPACVFVNVPVCGQCDICTVCA